MVITNNLIAEPISSEKYDSQFDLTNVPIGCKQTELGLIPEDWDLIELCDAAKIVDSLHQTPSFSDDGYPMIRVTDIKSGNLSFDGTLMVTETVFAEFTKNYKPKRSDIVLSRVGSYGVTSFVETDDSFCMGQNTVVLNPKIPPRFLYYTLNSRAIRQQIEDGSYGSGYKSLSLKNIRELRIPAPHSELEQVAIATALSDMDALLDGLDRLIAKKRDLKQAAMQQLLTGQTRLPGFEEDWEMKNVLALGEVVTGGTPSTEVREFWGDEYPWITPTDISSCRDMNSSERALTQAGLNVIRQLPFNTVLVTCIASIGKNAILRKKGACNQQINAVIPNNNSSAEFLYYLFESSKRYLLANAGTTATSIISKATFGEMTFWVPAKKEQIALAVVLSDMDAEIEALEQRRNKTGSLKQAMMQELLTGRTRLI